MEPSGNKLTNVFLLCFTPHHFSQAPRTAPTAKRTEKLKFTISKIGEFLSVEQSLKAKWTRELQGFFSEDARFYDDLLVDTLHTLTKDAREEEVLLAARAVTEEALLLPLSESSLERCLELC